MCDFNLLYRYIFFIGIYDTIKERGKAKKHNITSLKDVLMTMRSEFK